MKKATILLALIGLGLSSIAQEGVKISSDVSPPHPSAMFEVASSSKGILIPRVDIIDLSTETPVTAPETSLMVYNTNVTSGVGFYYWDGSKWSSMTAGQQNEDWKVIGTTGTMANGEAIPSFYNATITPTHSNLYGKQPLSIRKRSDGIVEVAGFIYLPSPPLTGGVVHLFELPIGYQSNQTYHRGFMSPPNDTKTYQTIRVAGAIFQFEAFGSGLYFLQTDFQSN